MVSLQGVTPEQISGLKIDDTHLESCRSSGAIVIGYEPAITPAITSV